MSRPLAQRLHEAAAALEADRVCVAALLQAHGPAAQGSLLLLLAVPCVLPVPGAGTLFGLGVLALAAALWRGTDEARLPRRVGALEMPRERARQVLTLLARVYAAAGRLSRVRMRWALAVPARRTVAVAVAAMAVVLVLPIPFGNILPALALGLMALGLVFEDGMAVVLGVVSAALTTAGTVALLLVAADWGAAWLAQAV